MAAKIKNRKFIVSFVIFTILFFCCICIGQTSVKLWSRDDKCYLVSNASMPIWPAVPEEALGSEPLIMTIEMPKEFKITATGNDDSFALQPNPLLIVKKVESKLIGENIEYILEFSPDVQIPKDDRIYKPGERCARAAIMINPGKSVPGQYPITIKLKTKNETKKWDDLKASAYVLPELKNRKPKRLRTELFSYDNYKSCEFKNEFINTIAASGINNISMMRLEKDSNNIAQQLRKKGIKANILVFWHNIGMDISSRIPDVLTVDAQGVPVKIKENQWPVSASICHSWCIQNKEKFENALEQYIQQNIADRYDGLTNDNEESALTRDKKEIKGDLYTPVTIELFRSRAGIDKNEKLTPDVIVEKYADKWVQFRCWQSVQMSAMLSETLHKAAPKLTYGYYSGHKYVGELAGFSENMYATDWDLLAKEGKIDFGSSGYYGSTDDYYATTTALGGIPHVPAEMFIEGFGDFARPMPEPNEFAYRLMNSLMYGSGGFAIWYAQVLDGAGFYAISKVSDIAAEIENYIIDGVRCEDELIIPPMFDRNAVFAYQLGQKRLVVLINHSGKTKNVQISWKKPISKPDTVEMISGKHFGSSQIMDASLSAKSFAVFITLSEGN